MHKRMVVARYMVMGLRIWRTRQFGAWTPEPIAEYVTQESPRS